MDNLETLEAIASDIAQKIEDEAMDVKTFVVTSFEYASQNIKAEVLKTTADCVAAAESSLGSEAAGADKYAFAFGNIVAALEKDVVEFAESDIDTAIQAVIAQRNLRQSQAAKASA